MKICEAFTFSEFPVDTQIGLCKKLLENIPPVHYSCLRALVIFLNKVKYPPSSYQMELQHIYNLESNLTQSKLVNLILEKDHDD